MRSDRFCPSRFRRSNRRRRIPHGFERLEPRIVLCTNVDVLPIGPFFVEDVGEITFEVQLNTGAPDRTACALTSDVEVEVATTNTRTSPPATAGEDFVAVAEKFTIAAGQMSIMVPVQIIDDNVLEQKRAL